MAVQTYRNPVSHAIVPIVPVAAADAGVVGVVIITSPAVTTRSFVGIVTRDVLMVSSLLVDT